MSTLISINSPWIWGQSDASQLKLLYFSSLMFDIVTPQEIKASQPGWMGLRVPWSHGRCPCPAHGVALVGSGGHVLQRNSCSSLHCCCGFPRTPHIHTPHKYYSLSSRRGRSSFILIICLIFVQGALLACVLSLCIFLRQPFTSPQEIRNFLWVNCIHR